MFGITDIAETVAIRRDRYNDILRNLCRTAMQSVKFAAPCLDIIL